MAREMLLQGNTRNLDVASILVGEFFYTNSSLISRLSPKRSDDFQLALLFQAAVLKFSSASWIAQNGCSIYANLLLRLLETLHRIVYCFSEALQERISREIGGNGHDFVPDSREGCLAKLPADAFKNLDPEIISDSLTLPSCRIMELTATQAMVDSLASARRVHLVDLGIKAGSLWPVLMQALAARHDCAIELLKLTAIGKPEESETGKTLSCFAESMNIPFEFRLITSDLKDLRQDLFELSEGESMAVYSDLHLSSLLSSPDHFVSLLGATEKLNPCVIVVLEVEASMDSPVFLDRFECIARCLLRCFRQSRGLHGA